MSRHHLVVWIAAAVAPTLLAISPILAQDAGDAGQGHAFALRVCAECHAVEKTQSRSRNSDAPRFEAIAKTPGVTSIALSAALQTSHRTMPNLILADDELRDVIVYILSLK